MGKWLLDLTYITDINSVQCFLYLPSDTFEEIELFIIIAEQDLAYHMLHQSMNECLPKTTSDNSIVPAFIT